MEDINNRGLFMMNLEQAEKIFRLPVEEREAALIEMAKADQACFLGVTTQTGPEIAIDCLKKGIKAVSVGFKAKRPKRSS